MSCPLCGGQVWPGWPPAPARCTGCGAQVRLSVVATDTTAPAELEESDDE